MDAFGRELAAGLDDARLDHSGVKAYASPRRLAVLVEALTDNRNRAVADVRRAFSRHGGNLGENGCVAWMFEQKGYIVVESNAVDEDTLMEIAIDAGAEDVREDSSNYEIITSVQDFEAVKSAVDKSSISYIAAEITMLPQSTVNLEGKDAEQMLKLMETLEDCDDVQKVYTNADIPEELISVDP